MGMFDGIADKVEGIVTGKEDAGADAPGGLLDKVKDLAGQHGDQIDAAVDSATDRIDQATGGSSAGITEKVDQAVDRATDSLA